MQEIRRQDHIMLEPEQENEHNESEAASELVEIRHEKIRMEEETVK